VARSCRSVLAQTWRPLELLVVDDGSGDNTPEVLESLYPEARDAGVRYHWRTVPNGGPGAARNDAMSGALGDYFAFLDDDDLWAPDKLEVQMAAMLANPQAGASFTQFIHEGSPDQPKPRPEQMQDGWVFESLCRGTTRAHLQTFLVTRQAVLESGPFAPLYNFEDTEFMLRLALRVPFVAVPRVLTTICTPGQTTVSREAGLEGDLRRDELKLRVLREFAAAHSQQERYSQPALDALRARVYDEHIKHLIWLGRVGQARQAHAEAIAACGPHEALLKLRRKLLRARVAGWFGLKLKKP
jgi:glycosyltransferase involved in cell wall biosynthesis